jgi:hypothetical protein
MEVEKLKGAQSRVLSVVQELSGEVLVGQPRGPSRDDKALLVEELKEGLAAADSRVVEMRTRLERDIQKMRSDLAAVKESQSYLSSLRVDLKAELTNEMRQLDVAAKAAQGALSKELHAGVAQLREDVLQISRQLEAGVDIKSPLEELKGELVGLQKRLVSELRAETTAAFRSEAAAVAALDEQLWLTDQRLGQRIDELVHSYGNCLAVGKDRGSPPASVTTPTTIGLEAVAASFSEQSDRLASQAAAGKTIEEMSLRIASTGAIIADNPVHERQVVPRLKLDQKSQRLQSDSGDSETRLQTRLRLGNTVSNEQGRRLVLSQPHGSLNDLIEGRSSKDSTPRQI